MQIGDKFGHWTVVEIGLFKFYGASNKKVKAVRCKCDCSNQTESVIAEQVLLRGQSNSCGCVKPERMIAHNTEYSNGNYSFVYNPDHPNSSKSGHPGYVYKHRLIASKIIGRPLTKDEVVHHIDGNKQNNSPENLMVLTQSQHSKLHAFIRKGDPSPYSHINDVVETRHCSSCGRSMYQKAKGNLCSACIRQKLKEKSPSKEELEEVLKRDNSLAAIDRRYNVTSTSVRRWIRKYNLCSSPV